MDLKISSLESYRLLPSYGGVLPSTSPGVPVTVTSTVFPLVLPGVKKNTLDSRNP
jgi:hypothetical protein